VAYIAFFGPEKGVIDSWSLPHLILFRLCFDFFPQFDVALPLP
jgi:hypothetical protein